MNLREEITKIIAESRGEHADTYYVSDSDYSDKILKLFEKLINSRIQDIITNPFAESDEVISELEDIKKEVLK